MLGMLAPLGIVHGKPFKPDARVRGILERAAKVGNAMSRTIAYNSRNPNRIYAEGSDKWEFIFLTKSATFETETYLDIDASVTYSHQAMFTAEGMVQKVVGAGSQYLAAYKDGDGNWLDGAKSYSSSCESRCPGGRLLVRDGLRRRDALDDCERSGARAGFECQAENQSRMARWISILDLKRLKDSKVIG